MVKKDYVYKIFDLVRGYIPPDKVIIPVGTILILEKQRPHFLKELAQTQNMDTKVQKAVKQLELDSKIIEYMLSQLDMFFRELSSKVRSEVVLTLSKAVIDFSFSEVFDELLTSVTNQMGMRSERIATPSAINGIIGNYFDLKNCKNSTLLDGAAGYGFSATDFLKQNPILELNLQDIDLDAATISTIRFFLLEAEVNIVNRDFLKEPGFTERKEMKKFDFVAMTPPFASQLTDEQVRTMENDEFNRYVYGIPSRSKGDFAFVSSGLSALKSTGKAAFCLAAGTLFRSGPEQKIRQRLIDFDLIEAIVLLPTNLFAPYTGIASILLLCNKNKPLDRQGKILMVNASELGTDAKRETYLADEEIKQISMILSGGLEQESISKFVSNEKIQSGQLSPETYVYKAEIDVEEYGKIILNPSALKKKETVALKELVTLYRGYNASTKDEDPNGDYAVLKISDVVDGEIKYEELTKYTIKNNAKIENNRIQKNDLLLSIRGAKRKTAIFKSDAQDVLISQNFVGVRCGENLDADFLQLYLESPIVEFYFTKHMAGSTIPNLPIKEIKELPIPVMPVEKQREIVAAYKGEALDIAKQLEELHLRQKQLKIEVFEKMGLKDTFKIQ
ncbi:N-6 DNA methylase [Bacillus cereus group sp. BcHK130]|uniref:N-6 DNA methylase n=1 Tax=Bacillus cereus group sp. BcHK130 TaxID=3018093 RepID=UPI0022DF68BD|nr:N-6 DNA methylase [Bacillus cereus group sp. BcHK130]MDA1930471.1 N-6 DNA methylase [Bacillus cereus group sp. BcHK130]